MIDLTKIDFLNTSIFDIMIEIMSEIKKNFLKNFIKKEIIKNIYSLEKVLCHEDTEIKKIQKILKYFYTIWNFKEIDKKHKVSEIIWLDAVFKFKYGTSFTLGIILLHFFSYFKLPVFPVLFPTQLILKFINIENEIFFLNPVNGEFINTHILELWLKGNISPTCKLCLKDLKISKSTQVIQKILNILKIALIDERKIELSLKVSEILLKLYPKDPYEIRDRGLIFSQLDCYHVAVKDLLYFVENCPEDPISEIIKAQIRTIERKLIIFH
ncbi:tetratricopeptide repeat protein [Buchnera aphidicola]|uniref:Protein sirB1 n=1 Tax=Buchnera aphidicola subsp. Tuberolachnus salignus TaxID=98804 RepID=A0A170PBM8_BUCTT|nr:tetratricopeptide repeat protein [Buchnera aphidicola]CUR53103.1 Protein sirB1 [Buchnera aphidicola (Tuberolachnus salignus)]